MGNINAKFLVGSSLVVVGVRISGYSYTSQSSIASALDVMYSTDNSTWYSHKSNHTDLGRRIVDHIYLNRWVYDRNMWRITVNDLSPSTTYYMKVVCGSDETSVVSFTTKSTPTTPITLTKYSSSWTDSIWTTVNSYWTKLYANFSAAGLEPCNGLSTGLDTIHTAYDPTSGGSSYIFNRLIVGAKTDNYPQIMQDEMDSPASATAYVCKGAYLFLHEMRHMVGISWCGSATSHTAYGWRGLDLYCNMDASSSFIETGNYGNANITAFPNTRGVYTVAWTDATKTPVQSGLKYYAEAQTSSTNDCQITDMLRFMRGSDLVRPKVVLDHSNFPDGKFPNSLEATPSCMADIEDVFMLRAMIMDDITILTATT